MEPGHTYFVDNNELIDLLKKEFYDNPEIMLLNRGKQNYEFHLGTTYGHESSLWDLNIHGRGIRSEHEFWDAHREFYDYLNKVTYPLDSDYKITRSWMKYYPEGFFSGLHNEFLGGEEYLDQHSNVILIDQPENTVGGTIVIAGDSMKTSKDPNQPGNLRERLYTRTLKQPGDAITWNEQAVHGVSKIEKGHRLVFVCIKEKVKNKNG